MLRSFEIAVQFLTVFKVRLDPVPDMSDVGRSAWAFPVVGAFIGALLVGTYLVLAGHLPLVLVAVVVVGLWVILTGGLHLDGWTDCWDALAASVSQERRFEILKDSRLGTFGALALILLLAAKIGAIAQEGFPIIMLFLAPILGRAIMVLSAYNVQHRGEGMGARFLSQIDERTVKWVAIIGLVPAILAGWTGIWAAAGGCLGAMCFKRFAESRLGTVNGDVIGAICELTEALVLLIACIR